MINQFSNQSEIQLKREQFHNQIRRNAIQLYFKNQRQILFESSKPDQSKYLEKISSDQELQRYLETSTDLNFDIINTYLKISSKTFLDQTIQKLFHFCTLPQHLSKQSCLVTLNDLIIRPEFSMKQMSKFFPQRVNQHLVTKIIEANLIKTNNPHQQYFCWVLFTMVSHSEKNQIIQFFQPLIHHYPMLEAQAHHMNDLKYINYEFLHLISALSEYPKLLPSQNYIRRLLSSTLNATQNESLFFPICYLFDNFISHCHNFKEMQNLLLDCVRFIEYHVKENISEKLKAEFIQIFLTIISKSEISHQIIKYCLRSSQGQSLINIIYYRANYNCWFSTLCLCFLSQKMDLNFFESLITPEKLVDLLIQFLNSQNEGIITTSLSMMNRLLENNSERYKQLFLQNNIQAMLTNVAISLSNTNQTSSYVDYIFNAYFAENYA